MSIGIGIVGRDEEQDRKIAGLETALSEIAGLGSDALVSRLEHVDNELALIRKQYRKKLWYRFLDWYKVRR